MTRLGAPRRLNPTTSTTQIAKRKFDSWDSLATGDEEQRARARASHPPMSSKSELNPIEIAFGTSAIPYDKEVLDELLVDWIAEANLPFRLVESKKLNRILKYVGRYHDDNAKTHQTASRRRLKARPRPQS